MIRISLLAATAFSLFAICPIANAQTYCPDDPCVCPDADCEGDGISHELDNCQDVGNPAQDDTDQDDCGNICDADYDQDGVVGFSDFLEFAQNFGCPNRPAPPNPPCPCIGAECEVYMHVDPIITIPTRSVGFVDFLRLAAQFGRIPGPSGSTAGTIACP